MVHLILAIVGAFAQPQIQEQIVEEMAMFQEWVLERVVEQIVGVPVLRLTEYFVEMIVGVTQNASRNELVKKLWRSLYHSSWKKSLNL